MGRMMEPQDRKRQIMIWYTIAAVIGVLVVQYLWSSYSQIETIPYSQFEQLLNEGRIVEVTISADAVQGTLKEALPDGKRAFFTVRVDPQLVDRLLAHGVVVKGVASGGIVQTILSWVVPAVIFYLLWSLLFAVSLSARAWAG
jgi:cell division protease FtsH